MKRYEYRKGTSDKFWEVEMQERGFTIHYGRIGTKGQTKEKSFSTPVEAYEAAQALIQEKTRKGYVLVDPSASAKTAGLPPTAIVAVQIGEHTDEVAESVATWLTECLQKKMTPAYFKKIWERFCEGEDVGEDGLTPHGEVPGVTSDGKLFWEDEIDDINAISDFYRKAMRNGADKVITVCDNAFMSIVALRGDPGMAEILERVFEKEGADSVAVCVHGGPFQWPPELGPGTSIRDVQLACSPTCLVTLRDGTKVRIEEYDIETTDRVLVRVFVGKKKVREYEYEVIHGSDGDAISGDVN